MGSSALTTVPSKDFSTGGSEFGVVSVREEVLEGTGPEGGVPGELGLGSVELARCILARGGAPPVSKKQRKPDGRRVQLDAEDFSRKISEAELVFL